MQDGDINQGRRRIMNGLSRREFLKAGLAVGAAASWVEPIRAATDGGQGKSASQPNIVFILGDDYGLDDAGCYGSDRFRGRTPNLDALAAGGIRFERCYSTPLCGPTRCEIMTGRYPFRTGGLTNPTANQPVPQNEYPLARVLKDAGYDTCQVGKWRQMGLTPADWGFDEYITDQTAGGWYWQKSYIKNGQLIQTDEEFYFPDVMQDYAVGFLRRHAPTAGGTVKPFFLYYSCHLVHTPILRTPDSKPGEQDPETLYDDNVAYLDKQAGELTAELDRLGLRDNTAIVFSGDNGTAKQSGTLNGRQITGQKGTMMEGGSRVPLIANWKGVTPSRRVLNDLVDFSDLLPTFAEVAGARLPEGRGYDGHSFAPQLRGEQGSPREWIFVQLGRRWYVRDDGWKLNRAGELFDMKDSPFVEQLVPADSKDPAAAAARTRLQAVLDALNPAGGKTLSLEDQAAERAQAQKRRQQAAKKQNRQKASPRRRAKTGQE
jgi:arylsulfatase A